MRSRLLRFSLCLQLCLLALTTGATVCAATITVDLPHLTGTLIFDESPISTSFDAGVQFSSIDSIVVRVMGEGEEGELRLTSYPGDIGFDPDPPPPTIVDKPFTPPLSVRFLGDEGATIGNRAIPVEGVESTWQAEFDVALYESIESLQLKFYGHLLDGKGVVELASENHFITAGGTYLEILEPSVLRVNGAQIVITGTLAAVPTPGSGTLLVLGGGLLAVVRLWRNRWVSVTRLRAEAGCRDRTTAITVHSRSLCTRHK